MTGVNPLYFIVGMALLGLAPFFLMMVTSYVKIVVVTSLVRNALGVQQVPPAMVMNGLAIILSQMCIRDSITTTFFPQPLLTGCKKKGILHVNYRAMVAFKSA